MRRARRPGLIEFRRSSFITHIVCDFTQYLRLGTAINHKQTHFTSVEWIDALEKPYAQFTFIYRPLGISPLLVRHSSFIQALHQRYFRPKE